MKKSEIYKKAQLLVLNGGRLNEEEKLEMLRELIAAEDLALFTEQKENEDV